MIGSLHSKQIYLLSALYIIAASIGIAFEFYYILALPFALLMLYFLFTRIDLVLWVILFFTPLSITLTNSEFNLGLSLPTEPLLALVTAVVLFQAVFGRGLPNNIVKNPISIAIAVYLIWMLFTTLTSELPIVSLKYFIARTWFIVPYYLLMVFVLNSPKKREYFYWVFLIPLAAAAIYTLVHHSQYSFSKQTSTWVMYPLFKEHTSYGAVLAMYFPISAYLAFRKGDWGLRVLALTIFSVLLAAIIFSYTRAAWVSLLAAFGVWLVIKLKIRWPILALGFLLVLAVAAVNYQNISSQFEQNTTVSSEDLGEHVSSISNVSTDASNLERINRWKSALRMFAERPIVGWGPGTYMFLYAPFQKPWEKTIISTNAGDLGNAHSEYIGPMAESGIIGLITVLGLIVTIFVFGIKTYGQTKTGNAKELVLMALLGLTTYFTHGLLNNFLDMDKASAPVWGFVALIVAQKIANQED